MRKQHDEKRSSERVLKAGSSRKHGQDVASSSGVLVSAQIMKDPRAASEAAQLDDCQASAPAAHTATSPEVLANRSSCNAEHTTDSQLFDGITLKVHIGKGTGVAAMSIANGLSGKRCSQIIHPCGIICWGPTNPFGPWHAAIHGWPGPALAAHSLHPCAHRGMRASVQARLRACTEGAGRALK